MKAGDCVNGACCQDALFQGVAHIFVDHTRDESVLPYSLREVEAEGVALLCCEALGLDGDAYARGYLQHYLKNDDLTEAIAQRIIKIAHRIIEAGRATESEVPTGQFDARY